MRESTDSSVRRLARIALAQHPEQVAPLLERGPVEEAAELLGRQSVPAAVGVLGRLTPDRAARLLGAVRPEQAARWAVSLPAGRAAALLARLDDEQREPILAALPPASAEDLRALATYPAETAGGMMDPRVTSFRPDATVREVLRRLRLFRNRRIHDVFLVDEDSRLAGSVSLVDVVLADPGTRLERLAQVPPAVVQATDSRLAVLHALESSPAASVPVVDHEGRLLGVLRQSELLATVREAAAASVATMFGAGRDESALSPASLAVRKRLPWLLVNLLTAFLASAVVAVFESTIARFTALAVLLPVVAGQSGNTGAQALAVTMRGLALREIRPRQWRAVAGKELLAGTLNGIAVAVVTASAVFLWSQSPALALVIAVSMVISMAVAALSGAVIPVVLRSLGQDPAQSSSIVLTTVTDVVGFLTFLGIATLLTSWLSASLA